MASKDLVLHVPTRTGIATERVNKQLPGTFLSFEANTQEGGNLAVLRACLGLSLVLGIVGIVASVMLGNIVLFSFTPVPIIAYWGSWHIRRYRLIREHLSNMTLHEYLHGVANNIGQTISHKFTELDQEEENRSLILQRIIDDSHSPTELKEAAQKEQQEIEHRAKLRGDCQRRMLGIVQQIRIRALALEAQLKNTPHGFADLLPQLREEYESIMKRLHREEKLLINYSAEDEATPLLPQQ